MSGQTIEFENEHLDMLICFGDVQGQLRKLHDLLLLLDSNYNIFKSGTYKLKRRVGLQFLGDMVDRGPDNRASLEFIMTLCKQNKGKVDAIMGNHEARILREYVQRTNSMIKFGKDVSELVKYKIFFRKRDIDGLDDFIEDFGGSFFSPSEKYLREMSPKGELGSWLRDLNLFRIRSVGNKRYFFTHADIPEDMMSIESLSQAQNYSNELLKAVSSNVISQSQKRKILDEYKDSNKILHGRRFRDMSNSELNLQAKILADRLDVDYIVHGHTTQADGLIKVKGKRLIYTDVKLGKIYPSSPYYNLIKNTGEDADAGALIITPNKMFTHYTEKGRIELLGL